MSTELTITCPVHFGRGPKGQRQLQAGAPPAPAAAPPGRVPHLAKLMALAIRLERLLAEGHVADMAELARLGHVTRARVTQIMNLRFLAPDIQEELLFLPPVATGRDPLKEWQLRPIVAVLDWGKQRRLWRELKAGLTPGEPRP